MGSTENISSPYGLCLFSSIRCISNRRVFRYCRISFPHNLASSSLYFCVSVSFLHVDRGSIKRWCKHNETCCVIPLHKLVCYTLEPGKRLVQPPVSQIASRVAASCGICCVTYQLHTGLTATTGVRPTRHRPAGVMVSAWKCLSPQTQTLRTRDAAVKGAQGIQQLSCMGCIYV